MKSGSNIDHLFRKGLASSESNPPPHIWSGIDTVMEHQRQQRRQWLKFWHLAPAFITAVFLLGILIPKSPEPIHYADSEFRYESGASSGASQAIQPPSQPAATPLRSKLHSGSSQTFLQDASLPQTTRTATASSEQSIQHLHALPKEGAGNSTSTDHGVNKNSPLNSGVVESELNLPLETVTPVKSVQVSLSSLSKLELPEAAYSAPEHFITRLNTSPAVEKKWSIRLGGGPLFVADNGVSKSTDFASIFGANNEFEESSSLHTRAGLQAAFGLTFNTWEVELWSGLYFNGFQRNTARENLMSIPLNQVGVNTESLPVFTSLGALSGLSLFPNLGAGDSEGPELSPEVGADEKLKSISQHIAHLSIPFGLGISKQWKRWSLFGSAGIGPAFLIHNTVQGNRSSGSDYLGETQRLAPVHWQTMAETGIGFRISRNLNLGSSVVFQQALSSLSSDPNNRIMPTQLGASLWLRINLGAKP